MINVLHRKEYVKWGIFHFQRTNLDLTHALSIFFSIYTNFCHPILPGSYIPFTLGQGSVNFFCKKADIKYFRLCRPYNLGHNYTILLFQVEAARDNPYSNEDSCVPIDICGHSSLNFNDIILPLIFSSYLKIQKPPLTCGLYKYRCQARFGLWVVVWQLLANNSTTFSRTG